jgi:exodeoxyribonuclease VII small subunit
VNTPPQYARIHSFKSAPGQVRIWETNMAENTQIDVTKLTFERAIEELESIVKRLEDGKVPLEESVAIYERGEALKRRCEELLRQAEARVDKITIDANGQVTGTEPLDVQ